MKFHFIGRNIKVTDALKDFATQKLQSLEKRYNHINSINVVLQVESTKQIAEATIHINGAEIHATAADKDMYNAINALTDKLSGQITKHKEKEIEQHR